MDDVCGRVLGMDWFDLYRVLGGSEGEFGYGSENDADEDEYVFGVDEDGRYGEYIGYGDVGRVTEDCEFSIELTLSVCDVGAVNELACVVCVSICSGDEETAGMERVE